MNAMTGNDHPAAMRASDADRDAVLSDLSDHFQTGRLTAEEFEERTGQALAARTLGELSELLADLPATRPATAASGARSLPPTGHGAPRLALVLAGTAIAAAVLVHAVHGSGSGFIWLLIPVLLIARRLTCSRVSA